MPRHNDKMNCATLTLQETIYYDTFQVACYVEHQIFLSRENAQWAACEPLFSMVRKLLPGYNSVRSEVFKPRYTVTDEPNMRLLLSRNLLFYAYAVLTSEEFDWGNLPFMDLLLTVCDDVAHRPRNERDEPEVDVYQIVFNALWHQYRKLPFKKCICTALGLLRFGICDVDVADAVLGYFK